MQKYLVWGILQIIILQFGKVENANILAIFPLPVKSHFVMTKTILESLAARGHNIDVYAGFPEGKRIPGISHNQIPGIKTMDDTPLSVTDLRAMSVPTMISLMFEEERSGNDLCQTCFQKEIMKQLRNSKKQYDLLLVEIFVIDCFFGYAHVFKTPVVAITSSVNLPWGSSRFGNMDNPSYIPTYYGEFGDDMTLYERIVNTMTLVYAKYKHKIHLQYQEELAREFFGSDMPSLDDIVSNTSLLLVNSHFSLNQARPNTPNVVEIAGVHIGEPKPLTKDFSDIIGDSKFIYFSFGSIAKSETITFDKLQYICDIFKELNYKVLWKADRNLLPKELIVPENVHTISWMPQLDILCHPNILFFITHSGLMGTQEAVNCGVPMLSVPMFADQFLNARNIENKGIGLSIEIETATKEDIYKSMKELIENPKFRKNAEKLSAQFKDRPLKPLDEAVYWIEYVLKHKGAPQLRSRSADLSWYQYYLVDVTLIILSAAAAVVIVMYKLLSCMWKNITKIKDTNKKKL